VTTSETRASRAQKPRASTAERRQEILAAALSVFGTRGYNSGALAEIAEQAGMTHAGVLHHFGSKEALLVSVLRYRDDADMEGKTDEELPYGEEFLRHLIRTAEVNATRPGVVQAYTVLSAESVTAGHPAQEYFIGRMAGLRTRIGDAIRSTVGPDVPEDRVATAAAALIAVMDGLQVQWLLDQTAVDMSQTLELIIDSLLDRLTGERDHAVRTNGDPAPE
jgi:AcrR family transcriptional regulator